MPGLAQRNEQFSNATSSGGSYSISANGFWSKHRDDVSFNQLQKVLDCSSFFFNLILIDVLECMFLYLGLNLITVFT